MIVVLREIRVWATRRRTRRAARAGLEAWERDWMRATRPPVLRRR